ncbi:DivIVA domain-containing protein [Occultella aeris]|uniref:Cell wall synthesis protein Wag31 n=1 Tax=Occultella aeris TaxID=2761496 RepID=A0A7M4DEP3_9MICO|nr:DivIVA domain-containing protein [Occultella aeris]VZO35386.1 Cell cycle protein GpsB [Occultella aeris]
MISAEQVLTSRFKPTRFSVGYDQDEVDNFLDRVVATLRHAESGQQTGSPLQPNEVSSARFATTKWREGYDQAQVDALLGEVVATIEHHRERGAL